MKRWKAIISAFALAMCASVTAVGLGGWVIQGSGNAQYDKYYDSNAKKVAYTQDSKGVNTYFTSVESALEKTSSGTVYVIPGMNPTINTNCTVKSGVSLYLPYEDDLKTVHNVEDPGRTSEGNFSDYEDAVNNKKLCKSTLTLANNVTLTNQGTIFVGGILGRKSIAPTGMTVGNYSQIMLSAGSKIQNTGNLTCYGYIKESNSAKGLGKVVCNESGRLLLPLVVYDFRGGSFSLWAVNGGNLLRDWNSLPFNVFDFPNIQCEVSISGNSVLSCTATFFANNQIYTSPVDLVGPSGSSSLILLKSGVLKYRYNTPLGYAYDDYSKELKKESANRTTFAVSGDVNIASMSVSLGGLNIDTNKFHLPFSYKFSFDFQSGTIEIGEKTKFLAGSSIHVGSNTQMFVKKETVFYQNFVPTITDGRGDGYPRYTTSSELINDGTITISSSFGGIILSSNENARIITSSGYSNGVKTTEALTAEIKGLSGTKVEHQEYSKITLIDLMVFDPNSDATMLYSYGRAANGFDIDSVEGGKTYTSHHLVDYNRFGWYTDGAISSYKYGVRYVLNSNTATNPNSIVSFDTDKGTSLIKPLGNENTNLKFVGYYYASDFNTPSMLEKDSTGNYLLDPAEAVSYLGNNNFITLYGKWVDTSSMVTIQFRKYNDNGSLFDTNSYVGTVGEAVIISDYSDFNNTDRKSAEVVNVSKIDYKFKEWVVKDSSGNIIAQTNNSFTPLVAKSIYYIEPVYEAIRNLALIVKNARREAVLTNYYAINVLKIGEETKPVKDLNEHVFYVNSNDSLFVKTEPGDRYLYEATLTVNGFDNYVFGNDTSTKLQLSRYQSAFDSLSGPIRLNGSVRKK